MGHNTEVGLARSTACRSEKLKDRVLVPASSAVLTRMRMCRPVLLLLVEVTNQNAFE